MRSTWSNLTRFFRFCFIRNTNKLWSIEWSRPLYVVNHIDGLECTPHPIVCVSDRLNAGNSDDVARLVNVYLRGTTLDNTSRNTFISCEENDVSHVEQLNLPALVSKFEFSFQISVDNDASFTDRLLSLNEYWNWWVGWECAVCRPHTVKGMSRVFLSINSRSANLSVVAWSNRVTIDREQILGRELLPGELAGRWTPSTHTWRTKRTGNEARGLGGLPVSI